MPTPKNHKPKMADSIPGLKKMKLNGTALSPVPKEERAKSNGAIGVSESNSGSRSSREVGLSGRCGEGGENKGTAFDGTVVGEISTFISDYVRLDPIRIDVLSLWIVCSWMMESWDRFPHLAVTSPEKRCGKTRLLQIITPLVKEAMHTSSLTPAVIYRSIDKGDLTLLCDESEENANGSSERAQEVRSIFNASIDRGHTIPRCVGNDHEIKRFSTYCAKIFAAIGDVDGTLADRCLPIRLERLRADESVKRYVSRKVKPTAEELQEKIVGWVEANEERVREIYDELEPLQLDDDRLCELLLPLQAVCELLLEQQTKGRKKKGSKSTTTTTSSSSSSSSSFLMRSVLETYAFEVTRQQEERDTPGVTLLRACRDIFGDADFVPTTALIIALANRVEEPWASWHRGRTISAEALAKLLRPFGIRPDRVQRKVQGRVETTRGYFKHEFIEPWGRYLRPTVPPTLP